MWKYLGSNWDQTSNKAESLQIHDAANTIIRMRNLDSLPTTCQRPNHFHNRTPDERSPKKILYGELQVGKRSHGGQKKRYKDTRKASLKDFNIPTESWEQIAQDRAKWRGLIRRGAGEYETKRINKAEQKRAQRKASAKASLTELSSSDLSFLSATGRRCGR